MPEKVSVPNDQQIYSTNELQQLGLTSYKIRKLVQSGTLLRLNKRYYENADYEGEESDFYYVRAYAPDGVVCLLSAAVYYGLSTYIPSAVDVAVPRNKNISGSPEWPALNIHYYTDERFRLGITEKKDGKNTFRIYDMEKTVADIVFYKEKVGVEETKEILTKYLERSDRKLNKLMTYADRTKCGKIMRQYLEILV